MKKLPFLHQKYTHIIILFFAFSCSFANAAAQYKSYIIDSFVNVVDGAGGYFSGVRGGDTIFFKTGNRNKLLIRNLNGEPGNPVIVMNKTGVVTISTNDYYGLSVVSCRYIRISGQGDSSNFYGIQIKNVLTGCGIGIGSMSSDVEVDHVQIAYCHTAGIYAKTDPDCNSLVSRNQFTQYNTSIHDNHISFTGTEGLYIGSSYYNGMHLTCNGTDTLIMPPVLDGVKVYNNTITHTGWDGIQVSSAPLHCQVYNNTVVNDSQSEMPGQMSGILLGGGSKCDCNNNLIQDGKGDGIENHGLGGNRIYNNIIVNAGRTYLPGDPLQMKHGIFVSDISVEKDSAIMILFNDIINPKSDGIRFQSVKGRHNIIASNLIVSPGNYHYYPLSKTSNKAADAYVMVPGTGTSLSIKNNFFTQSLQEAGVAAGSYHINAGSPLINNAAGGYDIPFDFDYNRRAVGGLNDIGAFELSGSADTLRHTFSEVPQVYPNPVQSVIRIRYLSIAPENIQLSIYSAAGYCLHQEQAVTVPGIQQLEMDTRQLKPGWYLLQINQGAQTYSSRFIKL